MTLELWSLFIAGCCGLCFTPIAVPARAWIKHQVGSPQHLHHEPTSRLGGFILFLAYGIGVSFAAVSGLVPAPPLLVLIACALPVFLDGIWEDVTHRASPRQRLMAAVISAILASTMMGGVVSRVDFAVVDTLLTYSAFAMLITCFMVVGACNALNLIDGTNGLLGGTAIFMFGGLAVAAYVLDDRLVFVQALTMTGAIAGFLFWNYPRAHVFMGDGGAYFIGFIYAELSIQIVARNDHISAWFVIMLAGYPIMETLYSMYRRAVLLRTPSMQPDSLHLHSMIYHRLTLPAERRRVDFDLDRANSRVAPRLWLHGFVCFALAILSYKNTNRLLLSLLLYGLLYVAHYRLFWKSRKFSSRTVTLAHPERRKKELRLRSTSSPVKPCPFGSPTRMQTNEETCSNQPSSACIASNNKALR